MRLNKSIEMSRWVVWDRLSIWKKRQPIRSWRELGISRSSRFVDRAIRRTMEYWERRRKAAWIVYRSSEETLWSCGNGLSRWTRSWSLWRWCSVCMSICRINRPRKHSHNKLKKGLELLRIMWEILNWYLFYVGFFI